LENKPFIIGICGGTGSGKTTLINSIIKKLDHQSIVTIQHDSYYRDRSNLSPLDREKINYDHPDALETDLLVRHLKELILGQKVEIPEYDFTTHTRLENGRLIAPSKVIIVEGLLIFSDSSLRSLLNLKIFVDADDDIRFIRRLQRDTIERNRSMESVIQQYLDTVRLMHKEYVEPSKKYTDIILSRTTIAIDIIISIIVTKADFYIKLAKQ